MIKKSKTNIDEIKTKIVHIYELSFVSNAVYSLF
jgi:hypothetical protein